MTPIASFFQPVRNHAMLAALGVTHLFGPEIESGSSVTSAQWARSASDHGMKVITKNQQAGIPLNCVGFSHIVDEPNGKGILPSSLQPEFNRLRTLQHDLPIFLSLAGDKLLYPTFPSIVDRNLYLNFATVCDIFTVNFYSKNRNSLTYPTTHTALAVRNLISLTAKPVWAWIEVNDQQLPLPPVGKGTNRGPSPQEIDDTCRACFDTGAAGVGWFSTCASGKYGWPQSYWPLVDRNGLSVQPQYDKLKEIAFRLNPVSLDARVARLEERVSILEKKK